MAVARVLRSRDFVLRRYVTRVAEAAAPCVKTTKFVFEKTVDLYLSSWKECFEAVTEYSV
jgi:hypothetical protein